MNFKFLTGDYDWVEYGGKWVSPKLNNGDFDYWLIIELINMEQHIREPKGKYTCVLSVVAPSELNEDKIKSALDCYGYTVEDFEEFEDKELMLVEVISGYGASANLWDDYGDDYEVLIKEAKEQAKISQTLFGFMMDKQQNMVGADGWDFIKGNIFPSE